MSRLGAELRPIFESEMCEGESSLTPSIAVRTLVPNDIIIERRRRHSGLVWLSFGTGSGETTPTFVQASGRNQFSVTD